MRNPLTVIEVLKLHFDQITTLGGEEDIRDVGLVEAALYGATFWASRGSQSPVKASPLMTSSTDSLERAPFVMRSWSRG